MRNQICNFKTNDKTCVKSNYTDEQFYKNTKKMCKTGCPFLWKIIFTQQATFNSKEVCGTDDLVVSVNGRVVFNDVLLMPSQKAWFKLSSAQESACEKRKSQHPTIEEFRLVNDEGIHYKSRKELDYEFDTASSDPKARRILLWHDVECFGDEFTVDNNLYKKISEHKAFTLRKKYGIVWDFRPIKD